MAEYIVKTWPVKFNVNFDIWNLVVFVSFDGITAYHEYFTVTMFKQI